jgi:Tfp pilus assembly protein PilX
MRSAPKSTFERALIVKQRGVVLIFALIALLAIMLAAVALIRSVDTSTMIAGNLAFKQTTTTSGDAGTEAAIGWLAATQAANSTKNIYTDVSHTLNVTDATSGYYSNTDPALSLVAVAAWNAITTIPAITDSSGNTIRYIIQRTCRTPGVAIKDADCLFSGAVQNTNGQNILLPQDVCKGPGCPVAGQTPMIRITSRVTGPKNTVSYVQAFVY